MRSWTPSPMSRAGPGAAGTPSRGASSSSATWTPSRRLEAAGCPQTRSLKTATAVVAIVLPDDDERRISHAYDDGRAAERMLIAAGMLGLAAGIAWVRPDVLPAVREILELPEDRMVRTLMALGHPTRRGAPAEVGARARRACRATRSSSTSDSRATDRPRGKRTWAEGSRRTSRRARSRRGTRPRWRSPRAPTTSHPTMRPGGHVEDPSAGQGRPRRRGRLAPPGP